MAIQGMRFSDSYVPVTIDVNEFYEALVEANKKKQSVVVKPFKAPVDLAKRNKVEVTSNSSRGEFLPVPPTPESPSKLLKNRPDLYDQSTDFLLHGVGGKGLFDDVENVKDLDAIKSALVELSDRIANL